MKRIALVLALALCFNLVSFAQKTKDQNLYVKVKDGKDPLIIVNGKKFEFSMSLLDQSKIESVKVLKGEEAEALYNTSNGVILITTKVSGKKELFLEAKEKSKNLDKPMIIIDGKIASEEVLKALDVNQIEKMEVLKGEKALKKHNSPGGVIILTTKKG